MPSISQISQHKNDLIEAYRDTPFVVFLAGPTHPDLILAAQSNPQPTETFIQRLKRQFFAWRNPSAELRKEIWRRLVDAGIEVRFGEDEGLLDVQVQAAGLNAQDNELIFIRDHCNAIILVADSVGSFCELGLFSWHFAHLNGEFNREKTDFILLVNKEFENSRSYFNEGPARAVGAFGYLEYVDFPKYDLSRLIRRLLDRKGTYSVDRRGRPRSSQ